MAASSVAISWTPTNFSTAWPSLKIIMVGILMIRNCPGVFGSLSTSCFITFAFHSTLLASSSRRGSIIWHGPHHSAQKSTRVIQEAILVAKSASVEIWGDISKIITRYMNETFTDKTFLVEYYRKFLYNCKISNENNSHYLYWFLSIFIALRVLYFFFQESWCYHQYRFSRACRGWYWFLGRSRDFPSYREISQHHQ